ncbi:MAG: substrate-binding domain-containing protein [Actinomycetota bacterium]|nr:substrate-binding domain-containing protein [Actinomycetota bacterium]MDQ2956514.1 substrate-binding domain-containing protein [Actinomycetota bacterium]
MTVIALLAAFGVGGTLYLTHDRPVSNAAIIAPTGCKGTGNLTLVVDVAPTLAVPVNQIAHDWTATNPKSAGKCIQVELDSDTVDQQELRLASQNGANTDVWLPDSSSWAQRLTADQTAAPATKLTVTVHPSLADSPLVAVTSPDRAATLASQVAQPNFDPLGTSVIAEPLQNAEGLLGLLSVETPAAGSATAANPALVAKLLQLSHSTLPTVSAGFDEVTSDPTHAAPFIASEQAVIAANTSHGSLIAAAVYPVKPTLSLDFPVVRLARTGDDPALASAADQFEKALRLASSKARFTAVGLRTADGTPVPKLGAADGVTPDLVPAPTPPTIAQTANMVRLWSVAISDSNTLAVIDVSGSMAEPAGNGQSKIAVATSAAKAAVSFFPDSSALGLWVFSSDQSASTPWAQLVPLGLLGDRLGNVSRRQALLTAASGMAGRVHGGTALYDTVLAAYQQVQHSYDPSKLNAVVLMTDGENDYRGGKTLDGMLAALRAAADPQRPVRVITIGIGAADGAALAKISVATGGKFYLVKNAKDISGVFLDAIAQRRCQDSC